MISIQNLEYSEPYSVFKSFYKRAYDKSPDGLERVLIASFDKTSNEVEARYVNLKYIFDSEWIFFTNYNSPKAKQFHNHSQISAVFYWDCINVQIRMKAKIKKTSNKYNQKYFFNRSEKKNALSISSDQSKPIESYSQVKKNYNKVLEGYDLKKCPEYWGGFSFTPYYFEFWEGHESRINKREIFKKIDGVWEKSLLQP